MSEVSTIVLSNGDEASDINTNANTTMNIDNTVHILMDRGYMARNFLRKGTEHANASNNANANANARYAIKTLSSSLMRDPERFVAGVIDLVIETKFLSIIRHPVSYKLHEKFEKRN